MFKRELIQTLYRISLIQIVQEWWHVISSYCCLNFLMNNLLRALLAGYGAKKLGGGCLGTIIVFIILWYALGYC